MIVERNFGSIDGREVKLIALSDGAMTVELISFGAAVRAIYVPDRAGNRTDVCLGYDTLEEYRQQDAYLGAIVGRCANRIGGAGFVLDGRAVRLTPNEGANQLHGGLEGFSHKVWDYSCTDKSVTFTLRSPDGDEGYPGNLQVEVTYTLDNQTLTIDYLARSDADTVVNLTNHAYFNLAGHQGGAVEDHALTIAAAAFTPAGEGNVPTGEIRSVEGTPLDFRTGGTLKDRLSHPFLTASRGFDHNFVLDGQGQTGAVLYCPRTGIAMDMTTTMEGMQLYSAGFLTRRTGKEGAVYGPTHGICLETQRFPDAVNHPNFPTSILRAGEDYRERTAYRFYIP